MSISCRLTYQGNAFFEILIPGDEVLGVLLLVRVNAGNDALIIKSESGTKRCSLAQFRRHLIRSEFSGAVTSEYYIQVHGLHFVNPIECWKIIA